VQISEATSALRTLENGSTSRDAERKVKALKSDTAEWQREAAAAGEISRRERAAGDGIYSAAFNLDFKNPHAVVDDHGAPEELLASLDAAEAETARLRDELKTILAEALAP
jgi:type I restriction enzyme M protein